MSGRLASRGLVQGRSQIHGGSFKNHPTENLASPRLFASPTNVIKGCQKRGSLIRNLVLPRHLAARCVPDEMRSCYGGPEKAGRHKRQDSCHRDLLNGLSSPAIAAPFPPFSSILALASETGRNQTPLRSDSRHLLQHFPTFQRRNEGTCAISYGERGTISPTDRFHCWTPFHLWSSARAVWNSANRRPLERIVRRVRVDQIVYLRKEPALP